ncbi:MAG TPA: hypothetical protein VKP30_16355 [Polyangiaceae bacterium]|nr:hypothetical protein [Polyangiaceae bacterium]
MSTSKSFWFWQRWLVGFSAICIAFSLVLAVGAEAQSALMDRALLSPFFDVQALPSGVVAHNGFMSRVLAGTMAGWAACMLGIVLGPFARRERWSWLTLIAALMIWFCIDTTGSALAKVWFNVFGNCAFLLAAGLPLLATRRDFARG